MDNYAFPTVKDLLEAGVHFGHSVNKWNPKMEPYIYAAKKGVHVLDLDQTAKLLKEAGEYLYDVASKGGQIIFVCTKKQVAQIAKDEALRCGAMYMSERWIGGTITNFKVIKKSIDKLLSLKKKRDSGELEMYTKKEKLLIDREIARLERFFGGIVGLKGEPQAVVVVDARRERTAINECKIFNVPVVALIDTNSDPTGVLKVIPGNDDAAKSVGKVLSVLADCIELGYKEFEKSKVIEKAKHGELLEESKVRATSSESAKLGSENDLKSYDEMGSESLPSGEELSRVGLGKGEEPGAETKSKIKPVDKERKSKSRQEKEEKEAKKINKKSKKEEK